MIKTYIPLLFVILALFSCEKSKNDKNTTTEPNPIPKKKQEVVKKPVDEKKTEVKLPILVVEPKSKTPETKPEQLIQPKPEKSLAVAHDPIDSEIYYEPIQVTLKASEGVVIKYTLDGSDPNTNGILFNNPLELQESNVIKFIAIHDDRKTDIQILNYQIDWIHTDLLLNF